MRKLLLSTVFVLSTVLVVRAQPAPTAPGPIGKNAKEIADGMKARFPVSGAAVKDTQVDSNQSYWVGIPDVKVSLNVTAPDNQIGRYDATVRVRTEVALSGFEGCALLTFMDEKGNNVYAVMTDPHGVNGTAIPGSQSDRTDTSSGFIAIEVLTAVAAVKAEPRRCEGPALDTLKATIAELVKGAEVVKDGLQKMGASVAAIIAVLKGG